MKAFSFNFGQKIRPRVNKEFLHLHTDFESVFDSLFTRYKSATYYSVGLSDE